MLEKILNLTAVNRSVVVGILERQVGSVLNWQIYIGDSKKSG